MATKKQAGVERPYTFYEFKRLIEGIAKEKKAPYLDQLDYLIAESDERKVMDDPYTEITSLTHWGGSEGIYTAFYMRKYDCSDIRVFVAKTLGEHDADYVAMHTLAGWLCAIANRYIRNHPEEFNWKGFDIDYTTPDGLCGGYCQISSYERARQLAQEQKAKGFKVTIRNNETRKIEKV